MLRCNVSKHQNSKTQNVVSFLNIQMERSASKIKKGIIFILLAFVFGCSNENATQQNIIDKYGYGMDSVRKRLGLPLMTKSLSNIETGLDFIVFEADQPYAYPCQVTKTVGWDSAGVYLERNYFYKSDSERLIISYWFKPTIGIDPHDFEKGLFHWYENSPTDTVGRIQKIQADSILRSWHLSKEGSYHE